jgi:peptidoglycan/xylan/chitin deacetylase (PgdA/CDA1 family)
MKIPFFRKKSLFLAGLSVFLIFIIAGLVTWGVLRTEKINPKSDFPLKTLSPETAVMLVSTPTPVPTPTPTPRPLTFAEMNKLYGPCVYLPTLMYHHIQDPEVAKEKNQTSLTTDTDFFLKQMDYLRTRGYTVVSMNDLINFFDAGIKIPAKAVLITVDDGYDDFYFKAYPILSQYGLHATVFTPTGLINNYGYLNWEEVSQMNASGLVLFANHTWSHKNVKAANDVVEKEITTADTQLAERGLNSPKVFAYPYGIEGSYAEGVLARMGYKLAFSTRPGSVLCKAQRFDLPRVRVGNRDLSSYGL